jgi:hypothetical protein
MSVHSRDVLDECTFQIELPFRERIGQNQGTKAKDSRMARTLGLLFPRYKSTTAIAMGNKATTLSSGTEAGIEGTMADKFRGTKAV